MKLIIPLRWTKNQETQINVGNTNQLGVIYKFTCTNKENIQAIMKAFINNNAMRIRWNGNFYESTTTNFVCGYVNDFTFHFSANGNLRIDDYYDNPPPQIIISIILPATGISSNWPAGRATWTLIIDGVNS